MCYFRNEVRGENDIVIHFTSIELLSASLHLDTYKVYRHVGNVSEDFMLLYVALSAAVAICRSRRLHSHRIFLVHWSTLLAPLAAHAMISTLLAT